MTTHTPLEHGVFLLRLLIERREAMACMAGNTDEEVAGLLADAAGLRAVLDVVEGE